MGYDVSSTPIKRKVQLTSHSGQIQSTARNQGGSLAKPQVKAKKRTRQ